MKYVALRCNMDIYIHTWSIFQNIISFNLWHEGEFWVKFYHDLNILITKFWIQTNDCVLYFSEVKANCWANRNLKLSERGRSFVGKFRNVRPTSRLPVFSHTPTSYRLHTVTRRKTLPLAPRINYFNFVFTSHGHWINSLFS